MRKPTFAVCLIALVSASRPAAAQLLVDDDDWLRVFQATSRASRPSRSI